MATNENGRRPGRRAGPREVFERAIDNEKAELEEYIRGLVQQLPCNHLINEVSDLAQQVFARLACQPVLGHSAERLRRRLRHEANQLVQCPCCGPAPGQPERSV